MLFHDRTFAAFLLINQLSQYKECDGIVLTVPRGGVPIGCQIAHILKLPLDIIPCKKIAHPDNPELAIGAVAGDEFIIDEMHSTGIPQNYISYQCELLQAELKRDHHLLQGNRCTPSLLGKIVILTDDGIATGNTMRACIKLIRKQSPKQIVLAIPVAPKRTYYSLLSDVDELVCLLTPAQFGSVREFYESFSKLTDDVIKRLLQKSEEERASVEFIH